MRGGAQAHLIEAQDGDLYVMKTTNNPQHRRTLVNEWMASAILRYIGISVPDTALVELTPKFISQEPELYVSVASRRERIPAGIHFGSRLAVDPNRIAIFDFLPDRLINRLENYADFLGIFVVDKWMSNVDSRQAVFFRARGSAVNHSRSSASGYFAQMIDHGFAFNGAKWTFQDSPLSGLYFRRAVYSQVTSLESFQPWLQIVERFPVDVIESAWKEIPPYWLAGDEDDLERLVEKLLKRRPRVASLIAEVRDNAVGVFPNWRN